MGLEQSSPRKEVLAALAKQVELLEEEATKLLGEPALQDHDYIRSLFSRVVSIAKPEKGLFLKEEKAKELFLKNPPKNILTQLGYSSAEELLAGEDLFEVFSALRVLENRKWQNELFFAPLTDLILEDFEERDAVLKILDPKKWGQEAKNFTKKKFHNTTHLKELGVVIVIPVEYSKGALSRLFAMLFHYLNELSFYADYFRLIAKEPENLAAKFASALRGDLRGVARLAENAVSWVIMQRYLAKEDPTDPSLLIPHISTEALHWARAAVNLASLADEAPVLSFWKGKAHICDFFDGQLTSYNFEDNVFTLAAGPDTPQYTYHAREALWNKFFSAWFDDRDEVLEALIIGCFAQGYVSFKFRSTVG